jgi:AP-2 complex subunit beta-1
MYWRLLSSNPAATRDIVLAEKPPISTETDRMDKGTLDQVRLRTILSLSLRLIDRYQLLLHTGTLSSIYHKSPQTFIRTAKARYLPGKSTADALCDAF